MKTDNGTIFYCEVVFEAIIYTRYAWTSSIDETLIVNVKLLTITIVFLCGGGKKQFDHTRLVLLVRIHPQNFVFRPIIQR